MKKEYVFSEYDYTLPDELIARVPVEPRDAARLFVYDTRTDTVVFSTFSQIGTYLPIHSLLVLNDTTVLPARVTLTKRTGGSVKVLFLVNEWNRDEGIIRGMVNKGVRVGESLAFPSGEMVTVRAHDAQYFTFSVDVSFEIFLSLLHTYGTTPLPHYLGAPYTEEHMVRQRYQAVFAAGGASAAAPTASLHFTNDLLQQLQRVGVRTARVRLDVGLGTFAPVTKEQVAKGVLHTERFDVPLAAAQRIAEAKHAHMPVVCVGTTAIRTVESNATALLNGKACAGRTNLFIRPGFRFEVADMLVTNFHLPNTSLMALVDAFLVYKGAPRRILDLYQVAIENKFRFYSFGDAMLVL